jgi:hypothetical protein
MKRKNKTAKPRAAKQKTSPDLKLAPALLVEDFRLQLHVVAPHHLALLDSERVSSLRKRQTRY